MLRKCLILKLHNFQAFVVLCCLVALAMGESQFGLFEDFDGPGYGRAPLPYARPLGAFGSYGAPLGNPYGPPLGGYGPYAPANYQFGYGVQTDDYFGPATFGHNEERNGYGTVGHYHVNTPGSYQSVSYNVGAH